MDSFPGLQITNDPATNTMGYSQPGMENYGPRGQQLLEAEARRRMGMPPLSHQQGYLGAEAGARAAAGPENMAALGQLLQQFMLADASLRRFQGQNRPVLPGVDPVTGTHKWDPLAGFSDSLGQVLGDSGVASFLRSRRSDALSGLHDRNYEATRAPNSPSIFDLYDRNRE